MRVSIILPTYNRADSLPTAIRSVLNQTHTEFELIVVDDGSTDGTRAVLASHRDSRVRILRHPVNRGVAAARNTGIAAATGDVLAFIDSDDVWDEKKLAFQVALFEQYPAVGAIFSDWSWVTSTQFIKSYVSCLTSLPRILLTAPREGSVFLIDGHTMYNCLLEELPVKPSAFAVRLSTLSQAGRFDETLRSGEDWELFLRLSQSTTWAYIDAPLVTLVVREDATHLRFFCEDKHNLIRILQHERRRCRHRKDAQRAVKKGLVRQYTQLYWFHIARNNRLAAAQHCWNGFLATGAVALLARMLGSFCPCALRKAMKRALLGVARGLQWRRPREETLYHNEAD